MQNDIHGLRCEMASTLERAARIQNEAAVVRAHLEGVEETPVHDGKASISRRVEELRGKKVANEKRQREFREELDGMSRGSVALEAETTELRRDLGRWRRAASEQSQRLSRADTKLQSLEKKRGELRTRRDQLEQLIAELCEKEDGTAAALQELRLQLQEATPDGLQQRRWWQATVALLLLLMCWLLFAW